jgi:gamma-glutamyl-gamma-aminobutyraldehyde dehydrogenase
MNQQEIDLLRTGDIAPQKLFIGGNWVDGASKPMDVHSPIDGAFLTTISDASANEVDAACAAARTSFEGGAWSRMAPQGRKKILLRWAELIEAEALKLAVLGVRDNGTEISMAFRAESGSAAATIRYYAESVDKIYGEIAPTSEDFVGLIHREPIGVVGAIIPWNFPLMIAAWKVGPALAAGNSVVIKPAETASLSLLRLAHLAAEAGLPEGVLNVVTGQGAITGAALAKSMEVDVLTFTGSATTGRYLLQYSAQSNLKPVYLELGGKSPNVVFADAPNLDQAANMAAGAIFRNSGQVCVSGSRLLVEEPILEDFTKAVVAAAEKMKVGDPLDANTQIGAINNPAQLDRVKGFMDSANEQGNRIRTGGAQILSETGGTYFAPTVIDHVGVKDRLTQEEVFGPVLAVSSFKSDEEAMMLANATDYGLAAGVWTSNLSRANRMVRAIKAGVVHVNTYGGPDVTVPMAGMKQSGNGADKSLHAMDKYISLKTSWTAL